MNVRRLLATVVMVAASVLPGAAAEAGPPAVPSLPMALLTISGTNNGAPPRITNAAFFPPGWSCAQQWNQFDRVFDVTCVPPAAPPGTSNVCAWVASVATGGSVVTTACNGATATAGGIDGSPAAIAPSGRTLSSLRCTVNVGVVPPNVQITAGCTTNH